MIDHSWSRTPGGYRVTQVEHRYGLVWTVISRYRGCTWTHLLVPRFSATCLSVAQPIERWPVPEESDRIGNMESSWKTYLTESSLNMESSFGNSSTFPLNSISIFNSCKSCWHWGWQPRSEMPTTALRLEENAASQVLFNGELDSLTEMHSILISMNCMYLCGELIYLLISRLIISPCQPSHHYYHHHPELWNMYTLLTNIIIIKPIEHRPVILGL